MPVKRVNYLIVGGGLTAVAAVDGIREHDAAGSIAVVSAEPYKPYRRPWLSKKLWSGGDEEKLWVETGEAELVLGRRMVSLSPDSSRAVDDAGDEYEYDKLLIATGGTPRRLGGDDGDVVYFRTFDDYRRLRERAPEGSKAIMIGGGFIGSEIAAALTMNGVEVTMVFPEPAINFRLLPRDLADFVTAYYRDKGVEVLAEETVSEVTGTSVTLGSGRVLEGDAVVAGLGIVPDTTLADGLTLDNGIVVDEYGRVEGSERIYAAGDVANFPSPVLGRRFRVEHEDHAKSHGRVVGANMAGANERYDHLPFFYSDLFELGYEAVGEVDSRLETVAEWQEPFRKGIVTYVDEQRRPRGFLLWDVWGKVDEARERIRAGDPVGEGALLA
ncbi:MAG TPA: FAD/NAD(P)-binding oxidoreductase [Gaiellaceae bacterium]|nr:FAD/NAD(P)-binding oxidoreductase [Gaiellaceae bacterium]